MSRLRALTVLLIVMVMMADGVTVWWRTRPVDIVVGTPAPPATSPAPGPTIVVVDDEPDEPDHRAHGAASGGRVLGGRPSGLPDGGPYGEVLAFTSEVPVPDGLRFVLVVGSDARTGEDIRRSRADSVHVVAVDPELGAGTVVGIPRDTYVTIPGHGRGKINTALALGGPDLLARAVRDVTGLPIHHYVLTGFEGFERVVDELGGVHVHVERRMSDRSSGAYFEPGWHDMTGAEALAFSRNRKDTPEGDFSRSENHGKLVLAAMQKMRAEIGGMDGVRRWIDVLLRHAAFDISMADLESLAVLGRRTDPERMTNVVAPGRVGWAGGASVVYLSEEAARLFEDLREDAVIGDGPPPTTTSTSSTTSTTTPPTVPSTTTTVPTTSTSTSLLPDGGGADGGGADGGGADGGGADGGDGDVS